MAKGKRANGARKHSGARHSKGWIMGRAIAAILSTAEPAQARFLGRPFSAIGQTIAVFWRDMTRDVASPYRPEKHYMRGPGPAWQAKYGHLPAKRG